MANMACAKIQEEQKINKIKHQINVLVFHSHSSDANNVTCFSLLTSIRLHHIHTIRDTTHTYYFFDFRSP